MHLVADRLAEEHPELLKVLQNSAIPLAGDDGQPIKAGELFEIFIGLAPLPSCFDWFIEEDEASGISAALAEFLCRGRQWRQCRDEILGAYPVTKVSRRDRFAEVIAGLRDYTAQELDGELLDLYVTFQSVGGNTLIGPDGFLRDLRVRAKVLTISEKSD